MCCVMSIWVARGPQKHGGIQLRNVDAHEFGLAALADEETGELERPISSSEWYVPTNIWLEGTELHWESTGPKTARSGKGMLEEFLGFADENGDLHDILRYAKQWGVLDICTNHGLPGGHPLDLLPANDPSRMVLSCRAHRIPSVFKGDYSESINTWRNYARTMNALLRMVAAAREGEVPRTSDCEAAFDGGLGMKALTPDIARLMVSSKLDAWIDLGRIRPHFKVTGPSAEITLGGKGLFGALVTQLIFVIADSAFAVCSSCGKPYRPSRKPADGRHRFCSKCGRSGSNRLAQRKHRLGARAVTQ